MLREKGQAYDTPDLIRKIKFDKEKQHLDA
jgi:hypothetical protein